MAQATIETTHVERSDRYRVIYERRTILGLIHWYKKVSAEKIGHDLVIVTEEVFDNIYLNNEKIK